MKTKYTINYFIKKLKAIHARNWCRDRFQNGRGQCCVMGHCGMRMRSKPTIQANALSAILGSYSTAVEINNGGNDKYQQQNPKARILAALNDVKPTEVTP